MAEPLEPPTTVSEEASAAMEVFNSVKVSLADLCAKGTAQYAHKNYEHAADLYARASELQAELNGEMSPDNAEILFLYGRSLFKVGQSKSDVLGGRAGGERKKMNGASTSKAKEEPKGESESIAEDGVAIVGGQNGGTVRSEEAAGAKKPLFQFTGDENFEDSDDDEEVAEEPEDADEDEEDDDLASAFEVLDLARVLFRKRLEQPEDGDPESKGKSGGNSPMTKHIKERLGDTHDLLAEISLENEKFSGAATDFRAALAYKQELYPEDSEIIAEAHYKLSLALEFGSIQPPVAEGEEEKKPADGETYVDEAMRAEAGKELETAIKSTKLKLQNKEVELASSSDPEENDVLRSQIAEVKEIVADMETKLTELRKPPVNVKDVLASYGNDDLLRGLLGNMVGESPADATARIEEAKKTATDLTGIVRKKAKPAPEASANSTNGKRKLADDDDDESNGSKKTKFETPEPSQSKNAKVEDAAEE